MANLRSLTNSQYLRMFKISGIARHISNSGTVVNPEFDTNKDGLPFSSLPRAKGLPIIGTRFDALLSGGASRLHKFIDRRHKRLGPIFVESMGPIDVVFLSNPEFIRSMFAYEGKTPKHPIPEAWLIYNSKNNCKRGIFFMDDDEWLKFRKVLAPILLRQDSSWCRNPIHVCSDNLIRKWKLDPEDGCEFKTIDDLHFDLYKYCIESMLRIMFGNIYDYDADLTARIHDLTTELPKVFATSSILMNIPSALYVNYNLKCWRDFLNATNVALTKSREIIELSLHRQKQLNTNDGIAKEVLDTGTSEDDMIRIFSDLIIAAGDEVASATQWAIYRLAKDHQKQMLIRKSIITSNSHESEAIKATIRETLRLYPIAPFIGRFITNDSIIGNYSIPKETLVVASLFSSGRDPKNFSFPDMFLPERWMRSNVTTGERHSCRLHKAQASVPYGMGARSCIGQRIANIQMNSILTKMVKTFNMKVNGPYVEPILSMITVPDVRVQVGIRERIM